MASRNINTDEAKKIANGVSIIRVEEAFDTYVSMSRRVARLAKTQPQEPYVLKTTEQLSGMRKILAAIGFSADQLVVED